MYLNVQISLIILFFFNFVNCFRESHEINEIYWNTLITSNTTLVSKTYKEHDRVSKMENGRRAALCKNLIKHLRNNEKYHDVYVNYLAILMYNREWCSTIIEVWVPKLQIYVKQYACACFIRSSIISLDVPHEYISYYQEIMIYPLNGTDIMLFKPTEQRQGRYHIVEIYYRSRWRFYVPVRKEIINIVTPQSFSEISNLQTIFKPIFFKLESYSLQSWNVINRSTPDNFSNMCRIAYGRTRYIKEFIVFPTEPKMNQERLLTVLRTENDKPKITFITAYVCNGHIPGTSVVIRKYKIAAGPNNTSVILLKETDCPNNVSNNTQCYEIIELIEYLSFDYVIFFFTDN